jgi:hypothetical protein
MIDHVKLSESDFEVSRSFSEKALQPLGNRILLTPAPEVAGMGREYPDFWIGVTDGPTTAHVAFRADGRLQFDSFHTVALAAGGVDNGRPGLRPQCHAQYYGAFILDPDRCT